MSTKTTLKRVSLVAVAALGFGLLSVVPSSATPQSDTLTVSASASSVLVSVAATTTVTQSFIGQSSDSMSVTASLVSSPAGNTALPILTVGSGNVNTTPAIVAPGLVANVNGNAAGYTATTAVLTASLTSSVAGTYVVKFTPAVVGPVAGAALSAAVTWTVTIGNAAAVTAADSTSFIKAGISAPVTPDAVVSASMATGVQVATILVDPRNPSGTISPAVALTATVSGPGTLGINTTSTTTSTGRAITGAAGAYYIGVFSDGTAGVSTITISQGSTVLATETVTFYGAIASIVTTVVNPVIAVGSSGLNIGAITAVAKDAGGNVVNSGTLYANSDTVGVVSNAYGSASITAGVATFTLTGVAAGTANITVGNGSTLALTTVSAAAVSVRVGSATPATVAVTFDKATYLPGETAKVTVSLKDASGLAVVSGTYTNIFATGGLVSNFGLDAAGTSSLASTSVVVPAGSTGAVTYTVVMPVSAVDVVLTATGGTGLPTAAQVAVTASASVTNSASDAATDAANAATDAANYAADAADAATTAAQEATAAAVAAQESADAATAAVVALGLRVDSLLASVRAQLTSIANLIKKLLARK